MTLSILETSRRNTYGIIDGKTVLPFPIDGVIECEIGRSGAEYQAYVRPAVVGERWTAFHHFKSADAARTAIIEEIVKRG